MTKSLSIDEVDLLNFFAVEPTPLEPGIPWAYNDSVYETSDGRRHISFAVAPSVKDVRILLKLEDTLAYELNAVGVEDIRYHNDKGRESVEIIVSAVDSIWLRIRPNISITQ